MASRCAFCNRVKTPRQPTTIAIINGVLETVHSACFDWSAILKKEANAKWDYKTLTLKK
jgi:hypothetical protein